jgi:hypothetical protein
MNQRLSKHTGKRLPAVFLGAALAAAWGSANAASDAVAQASQIWTAVPTTASTLQSLKVLTPSSGYVIVTVTGSVNFLKTSATQGFYCLDLSETANYTGGCDPDVGSNSAVRNYIAADYPATVPGYGQLESYSIVKVWPVSAGKAYTFYLSGYQTGFSGVDLFQPSITALYVPAALAP